MIHEFHVRDYSVAAYNHDCRQRTDQLSCLPFTCACTAVLCCEEKKLRTCTCFLYDVSNVMSRRILPGTVPWEPSIKMVVTMLLTCPAHCETKCFGGVSFKTSQNRQGKSSLNNDISMIYSYSCLFFNHQTKQGWEEVRDCTKESLLCLRKQICATVKQTTTRQQQHRLLVHARINCGHAVHVAHQRSAEEHHIEQHHHAHPNRHRGQRQRDCPRAA